MSSQLKSAKVLSEGDKHMQKGEDKLTKFRLIGNKHESAAKHFMAAHDLFKAQKKWYKAGQALIRCVDVIPQALKNKTAVPREQAKLLAQAAQYFILHVEYKRNKFSSQIDSLQADEILRRQKRMQEAQRRAEEIAAADRSEDEKRTMKMLSEEIFKPEKATEFDKKGLFSENEDRSIAKVPVAEPKEQSETESLLQRKIDVLSEKLKNIKGVKEASDCTTRAAHLAVEYDNVAHAAKLERDHASWCADNLDLPDIDPIKHFKNAVEHYEALQNYVIANRVLMELYVAHCDMKQFSKATSVILHDIINADWNADKTMRGGTNLLRFDINTLIFHLMLTRLACMNRNNFDPEQDIEGLRNELDNYTDQYSNHFEKEREYELIKAGIDAFEKKKVGIFVQAIKPLDRAKPLEKWLVRLLTVIRRNLEEIITSDDLT